MSVNNKWILVLALAAISGCEDVSETLDEDVAAETVDTTATEPLTCTAEQTACETGCADLATDPYNCGACGSVCASGLCYAGVCADERAGHIFAIGNSYRTSVPALDRILGNAVFLHEGKVKVLVYRDASTPLDIHSGTQTALSRAAGSLKRSMVKTKVTVPTGIQQLLPDNDVLVIEAMPTASDEWLTFLADEWSLPLDDFTRRGGIVVVLDGPSDVNGGTFKVLGSQLPLTRATNAPGALGYVSDANDISTGRIPLTFALKDSVGYAATSYIDSVTSDSGDAVVVHRAVF